MSACPLHDSRQPGAQCECVWVGPDHQPSRERPYEPPFYVRTARSWGGPVVSWPVARGTRVAHGVISGEDQHAGHVAGFAPHAWQARSIAHAQAHKANRAVGLLAALQLHCLHLRHREPRREVVAGACMHKHKADLRRTVGLTCLDCGAHL